MLFPSARTTLSILLGALAISMTLSCSDEVQLKPPAEGEACDKEGDRTVSLVCQGGVWVTFKATDAKEMGNAGGRDMGVVSAKDMSTAEGDIGSQDMGAGAECETDEQLCQRQQMCGPQDVVDNCGKTRAIFCGCDIGFECSTGVCTKLASCATTQQLCDSLEAQCGEFSGVMDNCGQTRSGMCGECTGTDVCEQNKCVCQPETDAVLCDAQGATCGRVMATDRCQETKLRTCGMCQGGDVCTAQNSCCKPQTDAQLCQREGLECGSKMVTDNCGTVRAVDCGSAQSSCTSPDNRCVNNKCACEDTRADSVICAANGVDCGTKTVKNACNEDVVVNCGIASDVCTAPNNTCKSNDCVCTDTRTDAAICLSLGYTCGTKSITDSCGDPRTIRCGSNLCTGTTNSCQNNRCVCQPRPDNFYCLGRCGQSVQVMECGQSRTVFCGDTCRADQCCGSNGMCVDNSNGQLICFE